MMVGIQGPVPPYNFELYRLLACLLLLCSGLACVTAGSFSSGAMLQMPRMLLPPDWPELAAAKAFCASPAFKSLKCGLAGEAEWERAVPQNVLAGSIVSGALWGSAWKEDKTMPLVLSQGGKSYFSYAVDAISLACKGPVVVRLVFKLLSQPEHSQNCSYIRLTPEFDFAVTDRNPELKHIPVVRCELQLPDSQENETARAVIATEGPCYVCTACASGGGCPANTGTWYSDAYVTDIGGCDAVWAWNQTVQETFRARTTAVVVNADADALVAKFEVCNNPGCFDAEHEAQKVKDAKQCVNGVC